jgi:kumamolisin
MRRAISGICFLSLASATALYAQEAETTQAATLDTHNRGGGRTVTPQSGVERPEDLGVRMHTNFKIFVPPGRPTELVGFPVEKSAPKNTPIAGYYAETPASLACLYGEVGWTTGCSPSTTTVVATGGSRSIAIVDAYDYPSALADLTAYSKQFGLLAPTSSTFTVVYASGTNPGPDPGCANENGWNCWSSEAALDIEMAHAAAPSAHIYLVEAASNSNANLLLAVKKAISLLTTSPNTGGEVSMSWGGSEFSTETSEDSTFAGTNVVFFASTGDSEGTEYPSVSPNVVAVGGTTLSRSPANLDIESEITWEDGGGGDSRYEARPSFQSGIASLVGSYRGVPDVAAVGNPRTGVWVYDSYETLNAGVAAPWNIFGGTSVASPLFAAIVNHAGHFYASSAAEHTVLYANGLMSPNLRDITYGSCGYYEGWFAVEGWDPCTGLGTPYGTSGK